MKTTSAPAAKSHLLPASIGSMLPWASMTDMPSISTSNMPEPEEMANGAQPDLGTEEYTISIPASAFPSIVVVRRSTAEPHTLLSCVPCTMEAGTRRSSTEAARRLLGKRPSDE